MVKGKKVVSLILVTAMVFSMLTACGDNAVPAMATVGADSGLSAYELAVQHGYDGTLEDWLQSLQGKSAYEIAVEHGYTGTEEDWIGRLNNLVADGGTYVKTASFNSAGQLILTLSDGTTLNIGGGLALKGADGANGKDGTNGSNGANGKDGRDGKDGKDGTNGKDGVSVAGVSINNEGELIISFSDGKATNVGKVVGTSGLNGKDGLSAYEIAVITGATTAATEAEWLESLKGIAGADGQTPYVGTNGNWWIGTTDTGVTAGGRNGTDGATGKSAYEIAKENGCTLSEAEWLASLKGADGQNGSNGKSAYEIAKEAGLTTAATEAEWLESLKGATGAAGQDGRDGKDGVNGKDGADGKDGIAGKDGIDGKDGDTPFIGTNGNWWIGTTDTGVKAAGPQGELGLKGDKGDKGETGAQGANGKSAYEIAIEKNLITNAVTEEQWLASLKGEKGAQGEQGVGIQNITLNNGTMTITLTDNTQFQFENIGSASSSGVAPQIRINTQTNEWEISSDSGNSWVSTGVKATGEKGADGADGAKGEDGISPKVQINAVTNEWELSVNNGLSWTSTGVKATGTDGKDGDTPFVGNNGNWWIGTTDTGVKAAGQDGKDGQNGADGKDGQNGIDGKDGKEGLNGQDGKDGDTPFIGPNGNWWIGTTDTGVKAAGQDGKDGKDGQNGADGKDGQNGVDGKDGKDGINGQDGKDGDTPFIGANGNWWISTTDTGVKAAGQDGKDGKDGQNGADGKDGRDGINGKDGKDGVSVTGVTINDENKLVITLSEGDPIIIDKSLMGATGAAGADGKDGNGISSVTLTPDFYLVFHYTDGTNSEKLGPIKGEKGDKGDDGVGIANVSLDANGNLYITYSNTNVPVLLGNARGPKGDTGDTGPAGPKGDTGADGKDGVGIKNAYVNSERHLILELTDGTTIDAGYVGVSEEPAATHTVIFKDWDGTELKRETVADGASATAPSDPIRAGYVFAGWDKSFTNVTADTIVTATYTVSAASPALKVSSITAAPGATKVTVMVSLENNPGFLTMALEMSFDSDVLTLTRVSNGADFTDYNFTGPKNKVSGCRAAWFSTDLPEEILDGDVMTLQFTVADNAASGRYPITISCPDDGSTLDGNKNVIALANAIGYITVD